MLKDILGSSYVYFQPPELVKMRYPCILYVRSGIEIGFADDNPYIHDKEYMVTVIDPDPDSVIPDKIAKLPKCRFDRHYTADNLNHDVFTIFY